MSLTTALRKAVYAAPLVFAAAAANVNAAPPTTIELTQIDLNRPIPNNVCFEDSSKGKGFDKLKSAMNARGQIVVATANQAVVTQSGGNPLKGRIFSSSEDGREGYIISLNLPKEQISADTGYCMTSIRDINIYNVFTLQGVPPEVNKGELGTAFNSGYKNGIKILMTARTYGGALVALEYSPSNGKGALVSADANGNSAGTLGVMASMGYSSKAKEKLGIQDSPSIAMAPVSP